MKVFIDTDVILDVLLERQEFFENSAALLDWAEQNPGKASVSWHGLANLDYLSTGGAQSFIRELLEFCEVPACGSAEMIRALELGFRDFEDALQTVSAMRFGAQIIATRNVRDFRNSPIHAASPRDVLQNLQ